LYFESEENLIKHTVNIPVFAKFLSFHFRSFLWYYFASAKKRTRGYKTRERERGEKKEKVLAIVDILCEYLIEAAFFSLVSWYVLSTKRGNIMYVKEEIARELREKCHLFMLSQKKSLITSYCGCAFDCLLIAFLSLSLRSGYRSTFKAAWALKIHDFGILIKFSVFVIKENNELFCGG
jgi:hypothetical protein